MNTGKRVFFGFMVFAMVSLSFVSVKPAYAASLSDGDLIKASGAAVYYYDADESERWVFPNTATYASWYGSDFSKVKTISDAELAAIQIGGNVVIRPGTTWVKITTDPKVYAVESAGMLRWVSSEAVALALHGSTWNKTIVDVPDAFFAGNYDIGTQVPAGEHPNMSLIKYANSSDNYLVSREANGSLVKRKIASGDAFAANWFMSKYVFMTDVAYTDGTPITGAEAKLIDPTFVGSVTPGPGPVTGSGVTVSLDSNNPVSATLISDDNPTTGADGGQAMAPFMALKFTASSDGDAKITTLKFTRTGVSSDTDISTAYLKEGKDVLATLGSVSSKVYTFTNSAGLFTVKKGESKTIWFVGDLTNNTSSGKTIGFSVADMSAVTTDGAKVSGSFPLTGNLMTTATVDDLGKFSITNTSTFPATIDAGPDAQEVWRFTASAQEQNIEISKIMLAMVGTAEAGASLKDLYLEVDGTAITSPVQLASDKTVTFNFDPAWKMTSGQSKIVVLKATVFAGAGRTFEWTVRKFSDVVAKDTQYGVYLKTNQSNSFALIESDTSSTGTSINSGTLTITRSSKSPTGNIALSALQQTLAEYDLAAYGEDIKVDTFAIRTVLSDDQENLNNGKLLLDGTQIGVTQDLDSDAAAEDTDCPATYDASAAGGTNSETCFTNFGESVIIKAGESRKLSVVADILDGDGNALDTGSTLTVTLMAGGDSAAVNATRQSSLGTFATNSMAANQLTLTSGTISLSKNLSFADGNASNASGVVGGTSMKIGSFTIGASSAEGASVTSITVYDEMDGGDTLADLFQNMKLVTAAGKQIGTTKGTLTDTVNTTYTFSATPAIELAASEQLVINIFADSKTGADTTDINDNDTDGEVRISAVTATGKLTSTSVGLSSQTTNLQNLYMSSVGSLAIALDSSTPQANQMVMAATGQTLGVWKLTAGTPEDVKVEKLVLGDDSFDLGAFSNLTLWNQAGKQLGTTIASLSNVHSGAATAGNAAYICLATTASTTDDYYIGMTVTIQNGTAEGESAIITDYDATGGACEFLANATFTTAPAAASSYVIGGQAAFDLGTSLIIPKGESVKVTLKGSINQHPDAVSGVAHVPVLPATTGATASYATTVRGMASNSGVTPDGWAAVADADTISANAQDIYRTKVVVTKSSVSPSGTSVAGANQEVLRYDVTADANRDAVVQNLALTVSGTLVSGTATTITGTGSANLYKSTDLTTALATEAYDTITHDEGDGADGGNETNIEENGNTSSACTGFPIGSNIVFADGGAGGTLYSGVISTASSVAVDGDDCSVVPSATLVADVDNGDIMYYYPLAAGSGKLYFGGLTTLTNDLADAATSASVASTSGFAIGDTVSVEGYTSAGVAVTRSSGCVITAMTATAITMSACQLSSDGTIDEDYLYSASNLPTYEAFTLKFWGRPIVYTGILNSNAGEEVSKGTTKTFLVKGDTTGLNTNDTLRVDINAASDFGWDDGLVHTIVTDTRDMPITGGTLIY